MLLVGSSILSILKISLKNDIDYLTSSIFLGYGLVSSFVFIYGNWFELNHYIFIHIAIILTILLLFFASDIFKRIIIILANFSKIKFTLTSRLDYVYVIFLLCLFFTFANNFISSFAPPSDADSLNFHLSIPKYYVDVGSIIPLIYYNFLLSPANSEMWNILSLLLIDDRLPQLVQCSVGFFTVLILYRIGEERISKLAGLFVSTFYYLNPKIIMLSSVAKCDPIYFGYIFLSFHTILLWIEKSNLRYFYLSAIFVGYSLATKFHGIFWALSIGVLLLRYLFYKNENKTSLKITHLFIYILISALIVSPYYLRNYIFTGDPIWPFGWSFFNAQYWNQALHDKYSSWQQGPGESIFHYIFLLWNVTINQNYWVDGFKIPYLPIQLAFLPGLYLIRYLNNSQKSLYLSLSIVTFIFSLMWFTSYQQLRYFLPVMIFLSIPSSHVFCTIFEKKILKYGAMFVVIISLLVSIAFSVIKSMNFVPVAIGLEDELKFLSKKVSFYEDFEWLNDNLPDDALIFFAHLKPYYLENDYYIPESHFLDDFERMNHIQFFDFLNNKGITHIFIPNDSGKRFYKFINTLIKENKISVFYENDNAKRIKSRNLNIHSEVGLKVFKMH